MLVKSAVIPSPILNMVHFVIYFIEDINIFSPFFNSDVYLLVGWNFEIIPGWNCLGTEWNRKLCSLILFVFSSLGSRVCNLKLQRISNGIFEILHSVIFSVHSSEYKLDQTSPYQRCVLSELFIVWVVPGPLLLNIDRKSII